MPAVREASGKHLHRRTLAPEDWRGVCGQAVKAFSASVGRALPWQSRGRVQWFLEKQRRGGAPAPLLLQLLKALGSCCRQVRCPPE